MGETQMSDTEAKAEVARRLDAAIAPFKNLEIDDQAMIGLRMAVKVALESLVKDQILTSEPPNFTSYDKTSRTIRVAIGSDEVATLLEAMGKDPGAYGPIKP